MSQNDISIQSYEVRQLMARFDDAEAFEQAVESLESAGINRSQIHLMASHDAIQTKLDHVFRPAAVIREEDRLPQTIYEDRADLKSDKSMAMGVPVYIGGAGAGLAVVASGGTLAFAALLAAAGAAVGAGIGALLAHTIGAHHANYLERQLTLGALLILVDLEGTAQETQASDILKTGGGHDIKVHTLTRYRSFDESALRDYDPYPMMNRINGLL